MKIDGSVAVVTGASSGIGRATCIALARKRATVIGIARRSNLLEELKREAPGLIAIVADLSTREGCEAAAKQALDAAGRVDILVNNAGISIRHLAQDTTVDDLERIFAINFFAAVYMTYAFLPRMIERKAGSIINITSVAGTVPNPQESAYVASKAGLQMWTHTLSVDLRGTGVHPGVVSPGPIDTPIWEMEDPAAFRGHKFPPTIVANAIVRSIEKERVHVTSPRRYGLPGMMYPLFGRPMRSGLHRYDRKARTQK
ncbi:MAG: SDR family NAD(P)-dependent oxidoreductase [Actinomycetota bacterium]